MLRLIDSFWVSRALHVVAELGIADLLSSGARTGDELAASTGTQVQHLTRLLRALSTVGVFKQEDGGRFALTPLGSTLRSGEKGSLRSWAILVSGEDHYRAWGDLAHSVRTGETSFSHVFGMGSWAYRAAHPKSEAIFNEAMSSLTGLVNEAIAKDYSFAPFEKVVDVGGGDGTLMITLLRVYADLKGVVFDRASVAATAGEKLAMAGLSGRSEAIAGDFFKSVPPGGDAYILSRVIHDWDDGSSVSILKECRTAMAQGEEKKKKKKKKKKKLLLVERVLPPVMRNPEPEDVQDMYMHDLNMMVMTGGRERTEAEYRALLASAGFLLTRIVRTSSDMSVIEGTPV